MTRAKKANNATVNERTQAVALMLVEGKARAQILQDTAKWRIAERTLDDYIARATELLAQESAAEFVSEYGKAKRRLELLFERTFARGEYGRALAVVKELNALLGLYPPARSVSAVGVSWEMPVLRKVPARDEYPAVSELTPAELEAIVREHYADRAEYARTLPPIPETTIAAILQDGSDDTVYGRSPWPRRPLPDDDVTDILT
jgi:hypothetical protein